MSFRRRMMMAANSKPYDAEIEYLESTGTQYIDTLYKGNTTKTEADMKISISGSSTQAICGSRNTINTSNNDNCCLFYANSKLRADWASGNQNVTFNCSLNTSLNITITRGKFILNNHTYNYSNSVSTNQDYTFLIYSLHNATNPYPSYFIGKIYYFKIYEDNGLVRDYMPVRVGTIGYMYDKVSGQLFGNSGTGSFILGPDVN